MNGVDAYSALDLSDGSAAVRALLDSSSTEAGQTSIVVSGATQSYNARQPAGLTPAMQAWYARFVATARLAAIAEVRSAFQSDAGGAAKGVYLEAERDMAMRRQVLAAIDQAARFADAHGELLNNHERIVAEFETKRAQLNRQPTRFPTWGYVLLLIGIVMLEAAINFESFLRVPYITSPFLATGATLAVGLAIGFASHFHGVVFRQMHYLFSPQEAAEVGHEERRKDAIRRLIFGTLLLAVALLMVGGARFYYLRDYIVQARILGVSPPSMFGGIIFMLLGNVVAYCVGALVAYLTHDSHPRYAELDRELRTSTKKVEELKRQRSKALRALREGADNKVQGQVNQDALTRGPRYNELREAAARIVTKDQEVIGALMTYRNALLGAMNGAAGQARFRYPDGSYEALLPMSGDIYLTADEYAAKELSLGFTTGEN
ncbi:hypothetical protein HJG53_02595 [Sphingomonas sp. ID1715]|uniref:hypothetical protein n=1 Tax=Sphingomonas sp. ID1715 TaxID=1656898 RepID=UPI001489EB40|nr:hypothetical protein [Sphingomonas sp. ID1715]NNM75795.1 hypothetical protein [Sphingomonas sp. ID1715]